MQSWEALSGSGWKLIRMFLLLGYSLTLFIKLSPSAQPPFQQWLDYITSSTISGDDSTMTIPLQSFMQSIELTWLGQGTFKQCTISCRACRHQLRRRYVIITIFQYLRLCLTTLLLGHKTQSTWSLGCHIPSKSSTDTLAQLAHHILSICPNSASHLWSMFGTILTRLWTQLGNKALLNIAELKLYLW